MTATAEVKESFWSRIFRRNTARPNVSDDKKEEVEAAEDEKAEVKGASNTPPVQDVSGKTKPAESSKKLRLPFGTRLCRRKRQEEAQPLIIPGYYDTEDYFFGYPERGYAIVINNEHFQPGSGLRNREGSSRDADKAKRKFREFGFKVKMFKDLCADETLNCLRKYAAKNHQSKDCFACFIMTHGDTVVYRGVRQEVLRGVDGESVPLNTVFNLFSDDNCPGLNMKPRLFFIQACRGKKHDTGLSVEVYEDLPVAVEVTAQTPPGDNPEISTTEDTAAGKNSNSGNSDPKVSQTENVEPESQNPEASEIPQVENSKQASLQPGSVESESPEPQEPNRPERESMDQENSNPEEFESESLIFEQLEASMVRSKQEYSELNLEPQETNGPEKESMDQENSNPEESKSESLISKQLEATMMQNDQKYSELNREPQETNRPERESMDQQNSNPEESKSETLTFEELETTMVRTEQECSELESTKLESPKPEAATLQSPEPEDVEPEPLERECPEQGSAETEVSEPRSSKPVQAEASNLCSCTLQNATSEHSEQGTMKAEKSKGNTCPEDSMRRIRRSHLCELESILAEIPTSQCFQAKHHEPEEKCERGRPTPTDTKPHTSEFHRTEHHNSRPESSVRKLLKQQQPKHEDSKGESSKTNRSQPQFLDPKLKEKPEGQESFVDGSRAKEVATSGPGRQCAASELQLSAARNAKTESCKQGSACPPSYTVSQSYTSKDCKRQSAAPTRQESERSQPHGSKSQHSQTQQSKAQSFKPQQYAPRVQDHLPFETRHYKPHYFNLLSALFTRNRRRSEPANVQSKSSALQPSKSSSRESSCSTPPRAMHQHGASQNREPSLEGQLSKSPGSKTKSTSQVQNSEVDASERKIDSTADLPLPKPQESDSKLSTPKCSSSEAPSYTVGKKICLKCGKPKMKICLNESSREKRTPVSSSLENPQTFGENKDKEPKTSSHRASDPHRTEPPNSRPTKNQPENHQCKQPSCLSCRKPLKRGPQLSTDQPIKAHNERQAPSKQNDFTDLSILATSRSTHDSATLPFPAHRDFLVAFGTPPGYVSWRRPSGSWFMSSLFKVMDCMDTETDDLVTVLTRCCLQQVKDFSAADGSSEYKAVPYIASTLTKPVYFRQKARPD